MAVFVFPDGNGSKLGGWEGGVGAGGQGTAGDDAPGNELVLDVKDDDLECASSYYSASSMGLISGMRNETSHFGDNYETNRDLWNRLPWVAFEQSASIQVNNSFANRKGLLGSFYTTAEKLLMFCGSLIFFSLSYPFAANAKETFEDHLMQGIIIGSIISFFIICYLTALASYLKDSDRIDGVGFHIFKWLVLLVCLFLVAGLCVILRYWARIPKIVLWSLGTVGYIVILSIWIWVFYIEVVQIQQDMKKHSLYEGFDRVPS